MPTHSLQLIGRRLKRLEFWQTHFSSASEPLRDEPSNQGTPAFIRPTEARPNLQQTYTLERRYFL